MDARRRWLVIGALLAATAVGAGCGAPPTQPAGGGSPDQVVGTDLAERVTEASVGGAAPAAVATTTIDAAARVDTSGPPTSRTPVAPGGTGCDLDLARAIGRRHPEATQLVVVRSESSNATTALVDVVVRSNGEWACQRGAQPAQVGRSGTRPLVERRSGDGTTPAGVFPLGTVTAWDGQAFSFFGNGPDPGVRGGTYRSVRPEDCWGATPNTAAYNHLVNRPNCPGPDDEHLASFVNAYVHAALIGANTEPSVSGDAPGEAPYAAAIFLHRTVVDSAGRPKATSGCVSLGLVDLITTLDLIEGPGTRFAIGSADWLAAEA